MQRRYDEIYDAVVIGAGHAGVEACLALARLGLKTLVVTLSLDAISFMACNPAIGGTAKGHLVREVDALGGQMGISADHNLLQIRMLNTGKGAAVQWRLLNPWVLETVFSTSPTRCPADRCRGWP